MTDRELLEAAAKAIGLVGEADDQVYKHIGDKHPITVFFPTDRNLDSWAPLHDDGDALRLAVKLGIGIEAVERYAIANVRYGDTHCEAFGDDPYAATRRAVVRAAAAVGANLE